MASTYKHTEQLAQILPEPIKTTWTFEKLALHFKIDEVYTEFYQSKKKNSPSWKTALLLWINELENIVKVDNYSGIGQLVQKVQSPSITVYYDCLKGNNAILENYSYEIVTAYEKRHKPKKDSEGFVRFEPLEHFEKLSFYFYTNDLDPFFIKYIKNLASAAYAARYIVDLKKELDELENPPKKVIESDFFKPKVIKEPKRIKVKCGPAQFTELMKMLKLKGWIDFPNTGEPVANSFLTIFEFEENNPSKESLGKLFKNDVRNFESIKQYDLLLTIPSLIKFDNEK